MNQIVESKIEPLRISSPSGDPLVIATPVILAPMAGVTNAAYRQLCAEQGAGVCVCEMITAQGLAMGNRKSAEMISFGSAERVRSVQTYGASPATISAAVAILCESFKVDHVDLNFGCPVPKITRKGGGGVLPWKLDVLRAVLKAAVKAADRYGVPVTAKTRIGIDDDHVTYREFGKIAQDVGVAAVCLHARTVAQSYGGKARWKAIGDLVELLDIPVIGNGDIWEWQDGLAMVSSTGCAGVEVGRGCLGRPWLFRDLAAAFAGQPVTTLPNLGEVTRMMRRHAELLIAEMGPRGIADFRKHPAWYLKGFPIGGEIRHAFGMVSSLEELDALIANLDPELPFPADALGRPRGRQGSSRKVAMPQGWLDSRCGLNLDLSAAEDHADGG